MENVAILDDMGDVFLFLKVVSRIYDANWRFLEGGSS